MVGKPHVTATLTWLILMPATTGLTAETTPATRPRRDAALRQPLLQGIHVLRDLPYAATANERQTLDLYLPEKRAEKAPLPVVVWIHGGAWRAGDKRSGARMLAELVASGNYAGASVGYRLTTEAIWPAQIHDCKAALRYIRAHAKKYHLDAKRIGVWGSSAGGHLVAMLGTSGGVAALEGTLGPHTDQDSRVSCVVDYFGPAELLTMSADPSRMDHDAADSPESMLVGGPLQQKQQLARAASPITYVSADDPPILIVHGDQDPLVPYNQSKRFAEALRQAGVEVTMITVRGGGHGGFRSRELLRRVHRFFDKHLRGRQVEVPGGTITPGTDSAP